MKEEVKILRKTEVFTENERFLRKNDIVKSQEKIFLFFLIEK